MRARTTAVPLVRGIAAPWISATRASVRHSHALREREHRVRVPPVRRGDSVEEILVEHDARAHEGGHVRKAALRRDQNIGRDHVRDRLERVAVEVHRGQLREPAEISGTALRVDVELEAQAPEIRRERARHSLVPRVVSVRGIGPAPREAHVPSADVHRDDDAVRGRDGGGRQRERRVLRRGVPRADGGARREGRRVVDPDSGRCHRAIDAGRVAEASRRGPAEAFAQARLAFGELDAVRKVGREGYDARQAEALQKRLAAIPARGDCASAGRRDARRLGARSPVRFMFFRRVQKQAARLEAKFFRREQEVPDEGRRDVRRAPLR